MQSGDDEGPPPFDFDDHLKRNNDVETIDDLPETSNIHDSQNSLEKLYFDLEKCESACRKINDFIHYMESTKNAWADEEFHIRHLQTRLN